MLIRPMEEFAPLRADLLEQVASAGTEAELWARLTSTAAGQFGASALLVLRRSVDGAAPEQQLVPVYTSAEWPTTPFPCAAALSGLGLIAAPPAARGGVFESLFAAIPQARRGGMVYAELNTREVLVLVFTEQLPVLGRGSWLLLDGLRKEAAALLGRVRDPRPAQQSGN